jgi:long-chain acyl-CoA synthetase
MAIKTLSDLFHHTITRFSKPDHLRYRPPGATNFRTYSSQQFRENVLNAALGLAELGVKEDTKIILLSENRPEWHFVDFACHLLGGTLVPIFPTLIPDQIRYIVNNSDSEIVVVSNQNQADKIREIRGDLEKVRHVISMEADAAGDDFMTFEQLLDKGRAKGNADEFLQEALPKAQEEHVATIIYTSGTTGTPKGVMLTHRNIVSDMLGSLEVLKVSESDLSLSFLPLSHSFERLVDYAYFYVGASIVYAEIEQVAQDLMDAKPTVMAAVPRFYEKIKARVEQAAEEGGGLKKKIFDWAVEVGKQAAQKQLAGGQVTGGLKVRYGLADKLVFSKLRERTGGRIRFFISGGAPLSADVALFFYAAGLKIIEGYGLTETSPVLTVNPLDRPKLGTVGRPIPGAEIKIAEDGEIIARGPMIMKGYYKMPEATAEVIEDGWFHTGDIGEFDEDGYLKITDRKKQILVTSTGKNVAPQPIEKAVESSRYIDQVIVLGDGRKFVSALVVPDFEALEKWAHDNNVSFASHEDLIGKEEVNDLIWQEIQAHQKQFSDYEKIRKFSLLPEPFSIEAGQLTPTMKIKRSVVEKQYGDLIEKMYAEE